MDQTHTSYPHPGIGSTAKRLVSQMVERLHDSISLVMRYGKSSGVLEIDPAVRRSSGQSLKKAAPGAPFGWTSEGTPYIGTQYCIQASPQGFKFASLSTRNGNSNYYWKPLKWSQCDGGTLCP